MPAVARIDPKDVFTAEEWAPLAKRSSWLGLVCVAGAWALIVAAAAMFIVWPNPLTYVLAVMIIGARQLGLAILMHDAAHGALHSNAKVNDWVGEWLCAAPVGARLVSYRNYHLKHHKFTEQPEDPDLSLSAPFPITRMSLWRKVVRDLTGQTFFKQRRAQLFGGRKDGEVVNASTGHFLLMNAILLAICIAAGVWWAYPALWLVPLATWFQFITRIRNIAEHAVVNTKDDPFTHARTTLANPIERLLIAPYWVHFHGEHHVFMHVPCYRLQRLHRLLMDKGYWSRMLIAGGYPDVLRQAAPG
ncbi:MAG: fatty acid desaturase family protein [Vitreimonas sp.]